MSRLLTPQELVLLQIDTDYLNGGIPVWSSVVLHWREMNKYVLIYRSQTIGYIVTDITDLGMAKITELAGKTTSYGFWYYLPESFVEVISEDAETAISIATSAGKTAAEIGQAAASAIGQTIADLIEPVIGTLTIPIVITAVLLFFYLFKPPSRG
ncbi:hypothetical protein L0244_38740 [bacterium]|nr:hypothetical protein [bacterium]